MNGEDSFNLPPTRQGNLRRIADMIQEAQEHRRHDRTEDDARVRSSAETLALGVLRERTKAHHDDEPPDVKREVEWIGELCSDLLRALKGEQPEPRKDDAQNRVLKAVNSFCAKSKRLPSRRELIDMGVRGEDVTEVFANLEKRGTIRFPKEKRGRKPGN